MQWNYPPWNTHISTDIKSKEDQKKIIIISDLLQLFTSHTVSYTHLDVYKRQLINFLTLFVELEKFFFKVL